MSTEQLPPQPTVTLGKDTKQHPQVWFTWDDTQAYARAAVAAYRARGEGERYLLIRPPRGSSEMARMVPDPNGNWTPVRTSPTAPDASQAERAYDAAVHNYNSAFGWQDNSPGAYEAAAKAHRQRGIEAVRAALQSEAARGRQP